MSTYTLGSDSVTRTSESEVANEWELLLSDTHLPWSIRISDQTHDERYKAAIRRQWVDDVALIDGTCDPCSGVRGRAQIAATEGEYVAMLINRGGSETFSQGGQEILLREGDAIVWDSHKTAHFSVWEPLVKRTLMIPRTALSDTGLGLSGTLHIERESPSMQLLSSYLDSLSTNMPRLSGAAITSARNATLELFRGAVQPETTVDPSSTVPARRDAIERWMNLHLRHRGALSAEVAAAAHGISVRTLNRVFNHSGETFSEVVLAKRIARVREELLASDAPISAIAHRWGFFDASHLYRHFHAAHGMSPRDYRDRARDNSEERNVVS